MKTGFIHGYPNKPGKKYYSYHGIKRDCLIQPDSDPFHDEDTEGPLGPVVVLDIQAYFIQGYYIMDYGYWNIHEKSAAITYLPAVLQRNFGGNLYSLARYAIVFDTTVLPGNIKIVEAYLRMNGAGLSQGGTNWNIVVQYGDLLPHDHNVLSDYDHGNYSGNGGETPGLKATYKIIPLNSLGISWIKIGGITRYMLRSSRDIAGMAPLSKERASYEGPAYKNVLVVSYQEYL